MKGIVYFLFFIGVSMVLVSCGDKRLDENLPRLVFSQDTVRFGLEGGESTITANHNVYVDGAEDCYKRNVPGAHPFMSSKHCSNFTSCLEFDELNVLTFEENVHVTVHPSDTANYWLVSFRSRDFYKSLHIIQGERKK